MSTGRNVDRDQGLVELLREMRTELESWRVFSAVSMATIGPFASKAALTAYTGPRTKGQIAYVTSTTEFGITADADYRWNGSAWKVWNLPATAGRAFPGLGIQGSPTAIALGAGGWTEAAVAIRSRRVDISAKTYWGTTAGTNPSTSLIWNAATIPMEYNAPSGHGMADVPIGTGYYYDGTLVNCESLMIGTASPWTLHWVMRRNASTGNSGVDGGTPNANYFYASDIHWMLPDSAN